MRAPYFAAILFLLGVSIPSCKRSDHETARGAHQKMLELLNRIAEESDETNVFTGSSHLRQLEHDFSELDSEASVVRRWELLANAGKAHLGLGNESEALELLNEAMTLVDQLPNGVQASAREQTLFELGVTSLRIAETRNCCARHTADSCILPIRGGGIHEDKEPARQAVAYFEEVLKLTTSPEKLARNLEARWLLNVAAMALGSYPEKIPQAHRIAVERFDSKVDFPRFLNVAPELGLDCFDLAGGVIADDFDNDDDIDLIVSTWDPKESLRYFENKGAADFEERSVAARFEGLYGGLNLIQADYDNDGDIDFLVLRGAWQFEQGRIPNSLLRNDGDGTFTDVTFSSGLGEAHYPTQTAAWADYDLDGDLDLYVGNESAPQGVFAGYGPQQNVKGSGYPSQLFRNLGNGTFEDVSKEAGVENFRFAKGVTWGDFDSDRYPDLYVSNLADENRLYQNNGDGTFTDIASRAGVTHPLMSFATWFWDFNNDGNLDLFAAAYGGDLADIVQTKFGGTTDEERCALYLGDGTGSFTDVAKQSGLDDLYKPMGANFGDLDNDGFLDFALGTGYPTYKMLIPNLLFHNQGGARFEDVTYAAGFGHLQKGHGIAFADFDHDGDLDVYKQMGGAFPGDRYGNALFQNPGFHRNWVAFRLVGKTSNRSAIGARLKIRISENGRDREIYREVNSGGSFGANPLRQNIGIGSATKIKELRIEWPSQDSVDLFRSIPSNRLFEIVEGENQIREVSLHRPSAR